MGTGVNFPGGKTARA